jgi:PGF-CTERM protein
MAHRDTNDNEAYEFVETGGEADGPYTAAGGVVMADATAQVTAAVAADAAASDGETVVVERVTLHDGGFVTVHDSTLADGEVLGSVRGTSEYLEPGTHENVEVRLDEPLTGDETVFAMAHRDTNDDEAYDFVATEGGADGPYVAAGEPVMGPADVDVDGMDQETDDEMTDEETDDGMDQETDDGMTDEPPADEVPGFGAAVGLLALLAAALLATRRRP